MHRAKKGSLGFKNGRTSDYNRYYRSKTLELLGGKCVRCGFSDPRALQADHVKGDGYLDVKKTSWGVRGGLSVYELYAAVTQDVANGTGKFQCLCANCNMIKRHENKEYGIGYHKRNGGGKDAVPANVL